MNKLQKTVDYLRSQGRFGDTDLVHVNPEEKAMLKAMGGAGTINPNTGLEEYFKLKSLNPVKAIKKIGSAVDDFVNDVVPGGWATVAAGTGLYFAPQIAAIGNAAEATALANGATAAEAATAGLNAATAAQVGATDYLGSVALGDATTGAVGKGVTGFGLGTSAGGTGISAAIPGVVGSNAASGLGYLGGMEALPAGTAGIAGVTAPSAMSVSDLYKTYKSLQAPTQQLASGANPRIGVGEMYRMQNPFFTPQEPRVAENKQERQTAKYLGELANLLRG